MLRSRFLLHKEEEDYARGYVHGQGSGSIARTAERLLPLARPWVSHPGPALLLYWLGQWRPQEKPDLCTNSMDFPLNESHSDDSGCRQNEDFWGFGSQHNI